MVYHLESYFLCTDLLVLAVQTCSCVTVTRIEGGAALDLLGLSHAEINS